MFVKAHKDGQWPPLSTILQNSNTTTRTCTMWCTIWKFRQQERLCEGSLLLCIKALVISQIKLHFYGECRR